MVNEYLMEKWEKFFENEMVSVWWRGVKLRDEMVTNSDGWGLSRQGSLKFVQTQPLTE